MDEPVSLFLGWLLLGFAFLLGYTAWKHVPGGAVGTLKSVLTQGKVP
jgi:hypothetical protein